MPAPAKSDGRLQLAANRIGWVKALAGVLAAAFAAGGSAYAVADRMASREDVERAVMPIATSGASTARRVEDLERWRIEHEARHAADSWWIRESLRRLMDRQGVPAPVERAVPSP